MAQDPRLGFRARAIKCDTVESFEKVLEDESFGKGEVIQVCEIVMDQFDYPWRLTEQIGISRARAAKMAAAK